MTPLIADLGTPELLIILVVVVLLFGSSKLPELARGSGRALRIFKAETKGLMDGDDETTTTDGSTVAPRSAATPTASAPSAPSAPSTLEERQAELDRQQAELDRLKRDSSTGA